MLRNSLSLRTVIVAALLTVLWTVAPANAFYLPGVAPTDYEENDPVPLLVNRLTPSMDPDDQQLRSVISYDLALQPAGLALRGHAWKVVDNYHPAFHFCRPQNGPEKQAESLGSILFGDRIFNSPFDLRMLKNESCKTLCTQTYDPRAAKFVNRRIRQDYALNWLIDGLPAARVKYDEVTDTKFYSVGFELGTIEADKEPYLSNHYDIIIEYHETRAGKYRVVGVVVLPSSHRTALDNSGVVTNCEVNDKLALNRDTNTQVTFTYSVAWTPSPTAWATRWDKYLHVFDPKIHWFSLINSSIIVIFLTGMVAMILVRTLHKDIARYNQLDLNEDVQEDAGWKLVHGDVFRAPKNSLILSLFLGSGAQLFVMTGFTIVFALLGFLSPSSRGSLATVMIVLYTLFGFIGGYVSARAYKAFGGDKWRVNVIATPLLVPGIVFLTFFFLNFFLIASESSGAVPLGTMVALIAIWFVISVPLSAAGSYFGFKMPAIEAPVRTNQIPRQIPEQPMYLRWVPSMLLAGILPFGAIFVELYFIMNSIWFHKVYYMFGFLFLCYVIMVITCATVTTLMVYFLLCSENYHWQWRSFFTAGACSIFVFLHAILFWVSKLALGGFVSNVLYLGYSLLISFVVFVLTGSIGFVTSYVFVRKIYGSIKID
ncbi:Endomembrane protein 70-domain-containing protein [Lipomyces tetrasporus]